MAYKFALPESSRIHMVFHVLLLKESWPNWTPILELRVMGIEDNIFLEPNVVLDHRLIKRNNGPVAQALIQWPETSSKMIRALSHEDIDHSKEGEYCHVSARIDSDCDSPRINK